ncbi:hypothetical protein YC2023_012313 [Brassica napus]
MDDLTRMIIVLTLVIMFARGSDASAMQKTKFGAPLLTEKIATNRSIIVDIEGKRDYTSVQKAIDAVPVGNSNWIIVHVRKGIYKYFRSPPDRYVLRRIDSHIDDYLRTGAPTISDSGSVLLPSPPRFMRDTTVYSVTDDIDDLTYSKLLIESSTGLSLLSLAWRGAGALVR